MASYVFLAALLLLVASSSVGARDLNEDIEFLYPVAKECKMKFSEVDYSAVTKVCKAPEYKEKECCEAFKRVACRYRAHVNDFSTQCPLDFVNFLNLAGSYPMGLFVGRCSALSPHNYRLCP